ncbi:MAG TPA: hypothetical protein VEC16_03695 [Alphaproteobacteria bacterium]|nr:hypothetical protein [Alphaproteobacteria bacterium]
MTLVKAKTRASGLMTMKIGIDFDNTIVNYEDLFHTVALSVGFISKDSRHPDGRDVGTSKTDVKDFLRGTGKEDLWTELQGLTYGKHIAGAKIYEGLKDFFVFCNSNNIKLYVISHKTMYPYIGEKHNLHNAAMFWLEQNGFFENGTGITKSDVFLELTKEEKIERIKALECDYFIDDLPELLLSENFPKEIKKILFDPNGSLLSSSSLSNSNNSKETLSKLKENDVIIKNGWEQITDFFAKQLIKNEGDHEFDDYTIERIDNLLYDFDQSNIEDWNFTRILGGKNNRAYRIEKYAMDSDSDTLSDVPATVLLMKVYHHNVKDGRNRIESEFSFLEYCEELGIDSVPLPIKRGDNIALYSFIEGRKPEPSDITEINIKKFMHFFVQLNENKLESINLLEKKDSLGNASEACFNIDSHLAMVDSRIERFSGIDPESSDINSKAAEFISSKLIPKWVEIKDEVLAQAEEYSIDTKKMLEDSNVCISPSDFGFHNALIGENNQLYFLDFEYAGIDDPSKLVNDFFARPEPAPDIRYYDLFLETISEKKLFHDIDSFAKRTRLLLSVFRIKWCCIMLNEFLKSDAERRKFAVSENIDSQKIIQLAKAEEYFRKNLEE